MVLIMIYQTQILHMNTLTKQMMANLSATSPLGQKALTTLMFTTNTEKLTQSCLLSQVRQAHWQGWQIYFPRGQ